VRPSNNAYTTPEAAAQSYAQDAWTISGSFGTPRFPTCE
jgi:hypothetical protein